MSARVCEDGSGWRDGYALACVCVCVCVYVSVCCACVCAYVSHALCVKRVVACVRLFTHNRELTQSIAHSHPLALTLHPTTHASRIGAHMHNRGARAHAHRHTHDAYLPAADPPPLAVCVQGDVGLHGVDLGREDFGHREGEVLGVRVEQGHL